MDKQVHINFSTSMIIKAIVIGILFYLAFYFRQLLLLILTSVVIASAVEPAVARLESYKISRPFGTILIYCLVMLVVIGGVILIVPIFVKETANLAQAIPGYFSSFEAWLNSTLASSGFSTNITTPDSLNELAGASNELRGVANIFFNGATGALRFVFESLFSFLLVFVLAFYFTVQKYGIDNFLKVVIPPTHIDYSLNLWHRSQKKIGKWMQGQLVLACIIGLLTYLGLLILGINYAFLLAIFAMFGSLIPMIGPVISMVPTLAVALADGGLGLGLSVLVLYFIIQQVESNLIYPMVVKNVVGVPALVVILGVIIGGSLFGFLGIVLSVPVAAAAMEYVRDIQKRNHEHEKKIAEATRNLEEQTS